jgi:hypothetical protein
MLFLHELHKVIGVKIFEFEEAYRTGWMQALAKGDDARLLWYTSQAMGTGASYNVITDRDQGRIRLGAPGAADSKR